MMKAQDIIKKARANERLSVPDKENYARLGELAIDCLDELLEVWSYFLAAPGELPEGKRSRFDELNTLFFG